jgi:hypothetical protein
MHIYNRHSLVFTNFLYAIGQVRYHMGWSRQGKPRDGLASEIGINLYVGVSVCDGIKQ